MTLRELALKYGTDKAGHHEYCEIYEMYLNKYRNQKFTLLELGVGGDEDPLKGGASLKMWEEYFPEATIYGVDINEKRGLDTYRTTVIKDSQINPELSLLNADVIIDDASHLNSLTIKTFENLYPSLPKGSFYFVEDIETSWWKDNVFDGETDLHNLEANTTINFFRRLLLDVNHKYIYDYTPKYDIEFIHFYPNLIVIKK